MRNSFFIFLALQAADFLTTAVVLHLGGEETNPIVRHFMSTHALGGLLAAKVVAMAIGAICLFGKKHRAMKLSNMAFAAIVTWNVTIVARLL